MQSKNIAYIDKLDHLRFLAAFMVLEYHAELWFTPLGTPSEWLPLPMFHRGYVGVELFMLLSGMILAAITYHKEIDALRFYLNRVLRIYPLFIFVVAFGYFATPDPREPSTGLNFLLALLPISNLYRTHYGLYGGTLWSVAVESQFYLLFPAILLFVRRYGRWYVPALITFLICLRAAVHLLKGPTYDVGYFSIFGALDIFLIGMLAGGFYVDHSGMRISGWWFLLGLSLVNVAIYGAFPDGAVSKAKWIILPTVQGLMFAALALAYLLSRWRPPFSRQLAYLGRISYSMYAWHTLVFLIAVRFGLRFLPPYELGALVVLPVTAAISALSYRLIEEPFLSMRVRYTRPEIVPDAGPTAQKAPAHALSE